MLYLEDFLELIENLPAELRDRFTEIRELDLQVQNGLDQSEAHVRSLFRNAPNMMPDERQGEFERIKEEYRKILEDSDEKVNLATTVHDLLRRYLAKLDVEISKFKMELEADKPGITEILEQSLKGGETSTNPNYVHKKERRKRRGGANGRDVTAKDIKPVLTNGGVESIPTIPVNGHGREGLSAALNHPAAVINEYSGGIGRGGLANVIHKSQSYPNRMMEVRQPVSVVSHQAETHQQLQQSLQQHLPAAHHQAAYYQQQQQLQTQISQNMTAPAIRERTGTGSGSYGFLPSFTDQPESRHGRPRKLTPRVQEMLKEASHRHERLSHEAGSSSSLVHQTSIQEGSDEEEETEGSGAEAGDLSDQNDQQRWCICNQVSYGEMVACDNKDCPFEWFHYQCVGVTAPPKGKWFCPHCTGVMKRRNSKNLLIQ